MRGVYDGRALPVQFTDPLQYFIPALGIYCNSRFIQYDQPGLMGDPAGDIKTPEQTAREFLRICLSVVPKPDKPDRLLHQFFSPVLILYVKAAEIINILIDIKLFKNRHILHDDPDLPLNIIIVRRHLLPHDPYAASVIL